MRARVAGARVATSDTVTFLDSHISAQRGWLGMSSSAHHTVYLTVHLEPLMARIAQDKTHVVMPIIDSLDRSFKYSAGGIELVGFNTKLVDHGINLQAIHKKPGMKPTDPQPSPAMAGMSS